MAILPLQMARVSNTLRTTLTQRSLTRTQQALIEAENQVITGKRITRPSDDPGAAALALQIRKTLEQRQTYAGTLQYASSHLSEVDSTMGDLAQLLRDAQQLASANVGSDVTADQRREAATVVDSLYQQAISFGNRQFQGVYLFGGDSATQPPFASDLGGVRFTGSDRVLSNKFDESTLSPVMVNGNQVFGALSAPVQGSVDLSPRLTSDTRLCDLRGAGGEGVRLGSIRLSDGTNSAIVDLSQADTVGDVLTAINAAGVGTITASIAPDANSLRLTGLTADITVADLLGGTTALDLGILKTTGAGVGVALDGANVGATVTNLTRLTDLRNGLGIDPTGLTITNGAKTATLDLSSATTVQDLLNAINNSGTGALAQLNAAGTGIDVVNTIQGIAMTIAENGGATAANLGIRSFQPTTRLSQLNSGQGVRTVSGADFQITRRNGSTFTVDLSSATTVQDVLNAINTADGGGGVTASFATTGNGIVLTDTTAGAGSLSVSPLNASLAADDLGIRASVAGPVLTGTDVNPIRAAGLMGNLARLRDALLHSDQNEITRAAEALQIDLDRVVQMRGHVGAQVQEIESRQDRLEEQNLAAESLLSDLEEVDYTEAITRYQMLQTALEANLQTAGKLLNLSLLDFLG